MLQFVVFFLNSNKHKKVFYYNILIFLANIIVYLNLAVLMAAAVVLLHQGHM